MGETDRGKLGLVLMGRAMLSKSLIWFSIDGGAVFPPCYSPGAKVLQARLQQYVNHEFPDVQAGFRKGRGTRDQLANICWIIEKARKFQKSICFIDYAKALDCVDHHRLWKILREMEIPDHLTCLLRICMQVRKQQLELDMEQQTGSNRKKLYIITLLI